MDSELRNYIRGEIHKHQMMRIDVFVQHGELLRCTECFKPYVRGDASDYSIGCEACRQRKGQSKQRERRTRQRIERGLLH